MSGDIQSETCRHGSGSGRLSEISRLRFDPCWRTEQGIINVIPSVMSRPIKLNTNQSDTYLSIVVSVLMITV